MAKKPRRYREESNPLTIIFYLLTVMILIAALFILFFLYREKQLSNEEKLQLALQDESNVSETVTDVETETDQTEEENAAGTKLTEQEAETKKAGADVQNQRGQTSGTRTDQQTDTEATDNTVPAVSIVSQDALNQNRQTEKQAAAVSGGAQTQSGNNTASDSMTDSSQNEKQEETEKKPEQTAVQPSQTENTASGTDQTRAAENQEGAQTSLNVSQETDPEAVETDGRPVIRLKNNILTLKVGDRFSPVGQILSITDDKDTQEYLMGKVHLQGYVSRMTSTAGTYIVTYDVTDSDGNTSDVVRMTILVEE